MIIFLMITNLKPPDFVVNEESHEVLVLLCLAPAVLLRDALVLPRGQLHLQQNLTLNVGPC